MDVGLATDEEAVELLAGENEDSITLFEALALGDAVRLLGKLAVNCTEELPASVGNVVMIEPAATLEGLE